MQNSFFRGPSTRFLPVLLFVLCAVHSPAAYDPPTGYYDSAIGLSGTALKAALHQIVKIHTSVGYSPGVWNALDDIDADPDNPGNVILLYSGASRSKTLHDPGNSNQNWWNREHTWALSHGPSSTSTKAGNDLFHLYAADKDVNANRGNLIFDDGPFTPDPEAPESGITTSKTAWVPRDAVKGLIARSLFYMVVRYEGDSDTDNGIDLELDETGSTTTIGRLSTLLRWHLAFPASSAERLRNQRIFDDYQHNRNPFIDIPEFVPLVFSGATPREAWADVRFSPAELSDNAISGDDADPDADGLPNILEYKLRSDPRAHSPAPFALAYDASGAAPVFRLTHLINRFATDVSLVYQTSTDLTHWTDATPTSTESATLDATAATETVTIAIPANGPCFVRLKVSSL